MALSFYSNQEMDHLNPILMPSYDYQSEVADALIGFYDPVDVRIDSLFGTPSIDILNGTETSNSNLFPCYSESSILSLPSDLYPTSDNYSRSPKRPMSCSDLYRQPSLVIEANPFNHSLIGSTLSGWQSTDFIDIPPQVEGCTGGKKTASGGYLSVQSVAARQRRKRISAKTQELGRLIPGGNKMNTAEMFQAAFKYVKFLQAQVGILGVMGTTQGSKNSLEVEEQTQVLVTSPAIQEKLYSEGKCIVSKGVVEALLEEAEIKSIPVISRDLDRLVQPVG